MKTLRSREPHAENPPDTPPNSAFSSFTSSPTLRSQGSGEPWRPPPGTEDPLWGGGVRSCRCPQVTGRGARPGHHLHRDKGHVKVRKSEDAEESWSSRQSSDPTPSWRAAEPCSGAPEGLCWSHHQPPVLPPPPPRQRPAASGTRAPGGRWGSQAPGDQTQTVGVWFWRFSEVLVGPVLTRTSGRGCVDARPTPSGE